MSEQNQRAFFHDYRKPCIYMITIATEDRLPLLGEVIGNPYAPQRNKETPRVRLSDLGRNISKTLGHLKWKYPQISTPAWQIMPDHVHLMVYVKEELTFHCAAIIYNFIDECNTIYQLHPFNGHSCLFSRSFNDRILSGKNQLQAMIDYIHDNPRRFLLKTHHPDFFRLWELQWNGEVLKVMGNLELLRHPQRIQVRISRRNNEIQLHQLTDRFLAAAREGAVLVSPFVSPGECMVKENALKEGLPMIKILDNGFPPFFKPYGKLFNFCAMGKLLLVSIFPYSSSRIMPTKERFEQMNLLAYRLTLNG